MTACENISLYYHSAYPMPGVTEEPFAATRRLSDAFDIALALVVASARSVRVERRIADEGSKEIRGEWFSFTAVCDESEHFVRLYTDHGNLPREDAR